MFSCSRLWSSSTKQSRSWLPQIWQTTHHWLNQLSLTFPISCWKMRLKLICNNFIFQMISTVDSSRRIAWKFSFQLDKTSDVSRISQILQYYVKDNVVKEVLLLFYKTNRCEKTTIIFLKKWFLKIVLMELQLSYEECLVVLVR